MKHTELKLEYFPSVSTEENPCFDISEDLGGGNFAYMGEVFEEDKAAFIVKAVNSFYTMLDTLKDVDSFMSGHDDGLGLHQMVLEAIAEAEKDDS